MTAPTPDVSTPEGRFLTAYGSWQHARMSAGFATMTAAPAQALALAAHMAYWTVELDQAWERLEGEAYTKVRDAHPARGILSALRIVTDQVGVLSAVEPTQDGPFWRPEQDLPLGPVDRQVYAEHAAGRSLFDETTVLDLFVNGQELDGGRGRQAIADHTLRWQAGEEAPHEPDPAADEAMDDAMDEIKMLSEKTPAEIDAYHAQRGGYWLTVVHDEDLEDHSEELDAWHGVMRQVQDQGPTMNMGGHTRSMYLFKGTYSQNAVRTLAQVARTLNPGGWRVVEGYHPERADDS